jgi:hypothetical protein
LIRIDPVDRSRTACRASPGRCSTWTTNAALNPKRVWTDRGRYQEPRNDPDTSAAAARAYIPATAAATAADGEDGDKGASDRFGPMSERRRLTTESPPLIASHFWG